MARMVLYGETLEQATKAVSAVRQVRQESMVEELGKERIERMTKVQMPYLIHEKATGWAQYGSLIHAVTQASQGPSPICIWSQKEEKLQSKTSSAAVELTAAEAAASDKLLCDRCKARLPASILAQAQEAGMY